MNSLLVKIDGSESAVDVLQTYGMVLEDMPSIIPLTPKNIYSHSWPDEDGDDEYIPEVIRYEAVEAEFTFGCRSYSADNTVFDMLSAFMHVRFAELHDDARYSRHTLRRNGADVTEEILSFTVTFKINDPKTEIALSLT